MTHACSPDTHPRIPPSALDARVPVVGDAVLYRGACAALPLAAIVVEVEQDRHDPNAWTDHCPNEGAGHECDPACPIEPVPVARPNPNVLLETETGYQVRTRQIRYFSSPGWCWPGNAN